MREVLVIEQPNRVYLVEDFIGIAPGATGPQGETGPTGPVGATGPYPLIEDVTFSTGSALAPNASGDATATMAIGWRLLFIATSHAARVRVYDTIAHRTSDDSRPIGSDPAGDHGCLLEYTTSAGNLSATLSPMVDGASMENPRTSLIPIRITNLSDETTDIEVTFTWVRTI